MNLQNDCILSETFEIINVERLRQVTQWVQKLSLPFCCPIMIKLGLCDVQYLYSHMPLSGCCVVITSIWNNGYAGYSNDHWQRWQTNLVAKTRWCIAVIMLVACLFKVIWVRLLWVNDWVHYPVARLEIILSISTVTAWTMNLKFTFTWRHFKHMVRWA